ncbi:hypothetical protein D3C81_1981060 [compost metagenome]
MIMDVLDPPQPGSHDIPDEAGCEAGKQGLVADQADSNNLQAEQGSGQRRPKNRAKAAADPAHEQYLPVKRTDADQLAESFRQAASHLHSRSFPPCGASE